MSEKIVSKFDREAFISKFELLPAQVQDGLMLFLETIANMTEDEVITLNTYLQRNNFRSDWGAIIGAIAHTIGFHENHQKAIQEVDTDAPASEDNE